MNKFLDRTDPKDITNEDILDFLRETSLSKEEVREVKELLQERRAYRIIFTKGKIILGMIAATILWAFSFLLDWQHLKEYFFKSGG